VKGAWGIYIPNGVYHLIGEPKVMEQNQLIGFGIPMKCCSALEIGLGKFLPR
jgi:hypothetical protein